MRTWRKVLLRGWEDYDASDAGDIRMRKTGRVRALNQRAGYIRIRRRASGPRSAVLVHQLVASAWLGPCPPGHVVDHVDNDESNNRPSNLQYVTQRENIGRAARAGRCGKALSLEAVGEMRSLYSGARGQQIALAARFGVSVRTVHNVVTRKTWPVER
jgi:hypothetical protein